uniref:RING-type E3 ubiquitin transferase n=1 Tax=Echinostoma caproni TaxID=27848 RepID=A0A183AIS4_9TREM
LVRQLLLLLMIDAELEQTQHAHSLFTLLYDTVSSNDTDAIVATESLFFRTIHQLEQDSLSDVPPTDPCPESTLRIVRPLIDRLGTMLRALNPSLESSSLFANFLSSRQLVGARERALFCPQRQPLVRLALWFSRSFCTAQLTDQMDEDLHSMLVNFLRVGKQHVALRTQFFHWLGACIEANRDLGQETRLAGTLSGSGSSAPVFPSDVPLLTQLFFLAHAAIRVGWTPLIARHFETAQQLHQLEAQWQAHEASGLTSNADSQAQFLRPLIRERTSRYLEQSTSLSNASRLRNLLAFSVTTSQLLVHLARTAFGLDPTGSVEHGGLSDLPEYLVDNIVELITEVEQIPLESLLEFSILFMLHTRALANPHLRARLAEVLESLIPLRDDEAWNSSQRPSGLLDVHNLSFLRRQRMFVPDSGSTSSEVLEHAVAALLTAFVSIELSPGTGAVGSAGSAAEVLIASASRGSSQLNEAHQSDAPNTPPADEIMNTPASDPHTATVGFEEKFQYRRPMYACLRFWHGNAFYDRQFHDLESEALEHIDDVTPPLFLQFLSLLVNDAIFLLDEAISLLAQLKNKERERDAAGGRLATQQEESLFAHTGRLARHHIMLGLDTIAALRRVVSICPRLITHPILVDRIACMLNYFLARLVGPKQRDLTVRDKAAYGFRPDLLVIEICQIYNSLALQSDVGELCNFASCLTELHD